MSICVCALGVFYVMETTAVPLFALAAGKHRADVAGAYRHLHLPARYMKQTCRREVRKPGVISTTFPSYSDFHFNFVDSSL